MRRRAMAQDFSWRRAIDDYERHFDWTMAVPRQKSQRTQWEHNKNIHNLNMVERMKNHGKPGVQTSVIGVVTYHRTSKKLWHYMTLSCWKKNRKSVLRSVTWCVVIFSWFQKNVCVITYDFVQFKFCAFLLQPGFRATEDSPCFANVLCLSCEDPPFWGRPGDISKCGNAAAKSHPFPGEKCDFRVFLRRRRLKETHLFIFSNLLDMPKWRSLRDLRACATAVALNILVVRYFRLPCSESWVNESWAVMGMNSCRKSCENVLSEDLQMVSRFVSCPHVSLKKVVTKAGLLLGGCMCVAMIAYLAYLHYLIPFSVPARLPSRWSPDRWS